MSLALIQQGRIVDEHEGKEQHSHAQIITTEIEKILIKNKINEIDAIAVHKGPGSFTGLRVGSSVAKGLCFGLDIPLIALDGIMEYAQYFFHAMEAKYTDVFCLIDARRDNYFYSHFSEKYGKKPSRFAHISEIETEISRSESPWIYQSNKFNEAQLKSSYLYSATIEKWNQKSFENISEFEPEYLVNNYSSKK